MSGALGMNSAVTCVESAKPSCPATGAPPIVRLTALGVRLAPKIGSLKTMTITALSGTLRFFGGGELRMTIGPFDRESAMSYDARSLPPAFVTVPGSASPISYTAGQRSSHASDD